MYTVHVYCTCILYMYIDGFASKPLNSILLNVQERQTNLSIILLILMCLLLTKCDFNRFLILQFV